MGEQWNHKVFTADPASFIERALEIFRFQALHNPVYKAYLEALQCDPVAVCRLEQIPFLPVRFFKTHPVMTDDFTPAAVFESSGTTGSSTSRHRVKDLSLYEESFTRGFERVYGPVQDWCIIGLLPSYLERKNSSLVYMSDRLIHKSNHPQSGFFLHDYEKLFGVLTELERAKQKTWLIGVTYALLDFAERFPMPLRYTTVLETGGMKGRREELVREEVQARLKKAFSLSAIHSEYGMTELLSQAYSTGEGLFRCPPWMKILLRDEEDPFRITSEGRGVVNVVDLANIWSCSFIATDDAGQLFADGSFEILGRIDGSDLRGCSLLTV
jgi:hypothetical protein